MHRYLCSFLLAGALLCPVAVQAKHREQHHRDKRYYDRVAHDYHEWNEHEERAYRHYLEEQKQANRAWEKRNRKEQKEYWKWRHKHPDAVIFPIGR